MNKTELANKILAIEGLSNEEKAALLKLLREQKKYGLVWEDKPEDIEERLRSELPVLTEVKERAIISDDPNAPNHILIEGDNLESLTELSYTHECKIDVIYIDPPYNTGKKDFVYNDNYVDREDGYRHSKWLSFMAKRLRIAKTLLSDNGVVFISIDDNEQAQLKLLCDEIFGSQNCLATQVWKSKSGGANDAASFGIDHEYILTYAKNAQIATIYNDADATVTTSYNKVDSNGRRYALDRLDKQSLGYQETLDYPIVGTDGKTYVVEHKDPKNKKARWRWGKETVNERYSELVFIYPYVYTKNYEKNDGQKPRSVLYDERFGRTRTGSTALTQIIGNQSIFNYPKPILLIKYLLSIGAKKDATILDFFAGSGTTLHATMQLNTEDGGKRKCILVTNNENGICENITYERNKRVIQGYTTPKGEAVAGLTVNNLRYYRTAFVDREPSPSNMRQLMVLCTDMLCIKEDLYTEQSTFGTFNTHKNVFRYFAEGEKKMLIIYREEAIDELVDEIYNLETNSKIKVYVFSPSEDPWSGSFADVENKVTLCALPMAIYNAYRRILPKKNDAEIYNTEGGES